MHVCPVACSCSAAKCRFASHRRHLDRNSTEAASTRAPRPRLGRGGLRCGQLRGGSERAAAKVAATWPPLEISVILDARTADGMIRAATQEATMTDRPYPTKCKNCGNEPYLDVQLGVGENRDRMIANIRCTCGVKGPALETIAQAVQAWDRDFGLPRPPPLPPNPVMKALDYLQATTTSKKGKKLHAEAIAFAERYGIPSIGRRREE